MKNKKFKLIKKHSPDCRITLNIEDYNELVYAWNKLHGDRRVRVCKFNRNRIRGFQANRITQHSSSYRSNCSLCESGYVHDQCDNLGTLDLESE